MYNSANHCSLSDAEENKAKDTLWQPVRDKNGNYDVGGE